MPLSQDRDRDIKLLRVIAEIRNNEAATVAAIRAGWPDAQGIVYRRLPDDRRDFAVWHVGDSYFMAVTGLEFASDFAATAIYAGDLVDIGAGIKTSSYLWATSDEAWREFRGWPSGCKRILAGHSAGGVAVSLLGARRSASGYPEATSVITYGMPKPFNRVGRAYLEKTSYVHYRFEGDPVVHLPLSGDNLAGAAVRGAARVDRAVPIVPSNPALQLGARVSEFVDVPRITLRSPYWVGDPRNHFIASYMAEITRPQNRESVMPSVIVYPSEVSYQSFVDWQRAAMASQEYLRWYNNFNANGFLEPSFYASSSYDEHATAVSIHDATSWFRLYLLLRASLAYRSGGNDRQRLMDRARLQVELGEARIAPQTPAPVWSSGSGGDWDEPAAIVPALPAAPSTPAVTTPAAPMVATPTPAPITGNNNSIRLFNLDGVFLVTVGNNVVYASRLENAAQNQYGRWQALRRNGRLQQTLDDFLEFSEGYGYAVVNGTIVKQ